MKEIVIGFTGTRDGMTPYQRGELNKLFRKALESTSYQPFTLRHGDCLGADEQAHVLARSLGARVIIHPPDADKLRAFLPGDTVLDPYPYLVRNHHIVDQSDIVIAAPKTEEEVQRSGTWATIRYARAQRKGLVVLKP